MSLSLAINQMQINIHYSGAAKRLDYDNKKYAESLK